jgi:hypothetical protein
VEYAVRVIPASPYRIPAERPVSVERVAPRTAEPPRAPDTDAEIENVACEFDAPSEPEPFPTRQVLGGFAIGGGIAVALTAMILLVTGWSPS